ncbi:Fc.00g022310.m01.CDS01 [Cosmosporella sp. VM-42]
MGAYGGRGPAVIGVLWTQSVVASIIVLLRVYTRKVILRSVGWDDLFLLITIILLTVYAALMSVSSAYGMGRHRAELSHSDYVLAMKYEVIGQGVSIFNLSMSKAAVGFFILRIARQMRYKVLIWFCIISNAILVAWTTIAIFIQCIPSEKIWDSTVSGNCWLDFFKVGITASAYAVVIDFTLALAPVFILWNLKMKRKDKFLAMFGLSLGVFAGICGILRTTTLTSLKSLDEYLYDTVDMHIYSSTENFVSAICASIPVLRPLWLRLRGFGSTNDPYSERTYQTNRTSIPDRESTLVSDGRQMTATSIFADRHGFGSMHDNGSEETILREMHGQNGHVFCRTEISVNYSSRGDRDDSK